MLICSMNNKNPKVLILVSLIFIAFPFFVSADILGQKTDFFVDPSYDLFQREELSALLKAMNAKAYFYLDEDWWNALDQGEKQEVLEILNGLGEEFEKKIYPTLTATFGFEWRPGIDNDERITILLHSMPDEVGGYTSYINEYPKIQNPESNEREMLYLNARRIKDNLLKSHLAHELVHLITFYQKEKLRDVSEEVWLNEARAEYAPTLLGYDSIYEASNLQQRVRNFIDKTFDSLTEWQNKSFDYGVVNLFVQYLVEHYGIEVLVDSLHSSKNGISSLNYALNKKGWDRDFAQIFTDWAIALFLNDCQYGERYCYLSPNLKDFRVIPQTNFLPLLGESTLSLTNTTKDWAGNWYKIVGGRNVLKVEFQASPGTKFQVPYLVRESENTFSINFFQLSEEQKGTIYVPDFNNGGKRFLLIIPLAQTKIEHLDKPHPVRQFSFIISTVERTPEQEAKLIEELLSQIEFLKKEIAKVQVQINVILAKEMGTVPISCSRFDQNLYYGMSNNSIKCLQEFLKSQGQEIYPQALVTGYFGPLTKAAVIRFQEKHADEILAPWGLTKGTGFVGSTTRAKLNEILGP